jgi:LysM repeat protein
MNNRPPISHSSSDVINSYRKRRQRRNPNLVYIAAGIFVLGGVIMLIVWMSGPGRPLSNMFATETPTPTVTNTPTNTPIPTETPTITSTATVTPTATFSTPFNYTVQDGDYLALIVEKYALGEDGIALILLLNPFDEEKGIGIDPATGIVSPGQVILLPYPGMPLPTATPIPPDLPRGTKVDYTVQPGDTLAGIASKFNSTEEEIIKENELSDPNAIQVGQLLVIPVNLVTPTATRPPTSTSSPNDPTATWTPVN